MSWLNREVAFLSRQLWPRGAIGSRLMTGRNWGTKFFSSIYGFHWLWLPSADLAVQRVATRVKEGGHNIPEEVVRRRYRRGLGNLFELYQPVVSRIQVRDGSRLPPALIWEQDQQTECIFNYTLWMDIQNSRISNDDN